ncbi:MAG: serine/threonine-protein kinase [Minicystis sp.]
MANTSTTSDYPLPPIGAGDTADQVFESAAAQSAEGGASGPGSDDGSSGRRTITSLQARLVEAAGRPVRLGRYDVIRQIGAGGMGVVYEAVNVEHGQRVALKTRSGLSGLSLYRLKREFRSLVGVAHPNIVALHELSYADGEWFFTMEYVAGASFVEHAQEGAGRSSGREYLGVTFRVDDRPSAPPGLVEVDARRIEIAERPRAPFHEARLRAGLGQLATAVAALHAEGKLHRDLNDANVLVNADGRVVVIDFGLVTEGPRRIGGAGEGISGTPGYMSPEQAAGKTETSSSDWYAFGVVLFEALTGRLPFFSPSSTRMLRNKQEIDAPLASSLATGVPRDLDDLCAALLRRRPDERPEADEVLRRLGVTRPPPPRHSTTQFVGRRDELGALDVALRTANAGRAMAVLLHGPAGCGKSALAARFADGLAHQGRALVLRGAVSAREAIPHRAFDALVDALALHLRALPPSAARALLPPEGHDLARVFPVLEGAVADLPPPPVRADEDEVVRFAFAALAEIVRRLAAAGPLVICLDDIDLADAADLARLPALCAASPERAPLLVLTAASEEPLAGALARLPAGVRRIRVDPLSPGDARALARDALRRGRVALDRAAEAALSADIARAAEGSPLAIEDLARWIAHQEARPAAIEAMIEAQLAALPDPAQRLLELLAAARAPIPLSVALAVAGVGAEAPRGAAPDPVSIVARLHAARLVRLRGIGVADPIEIHDERVRAVVAARVPPPVLRRLHLHLADALARRPEVDPAIVSVHLELGGALDAAAEHACLAADRAAAERDFERAAALYAQALAWLPPASAEVRDVGVRHAEALAGAGRAAEAARAFLGAAALAPVALAQDLRRRAAEHLLVAGHVDTGLGILRPVLAAHGLRFPETPRVALFLLAARLVQLRLRGTLPAVPDRPVSAAARARIEAAWSAGKGLSSIDPIRSAVFMVEALLSALSAGDPGLVARGLAFVGCLMVYDGGAAQEERGSELIEEAARIARRTGDPYLMGFTWCCSGLARMCTGRFREALARMDEGLGVLEGSAASIVWERNAYRSIGSQTLFALGALRERARRADLWLAEARAKADCFAETEATLASSLARLAAGEPREARILVRDVMARFHARSFTPQHHAAAWIEASSYLYEGAPALAWAHLDACRAPLESSQLLRIQLLRIDVLLLRGITAAALAASDRVRADDLLAEAESAAARLARERRPHALAASAVVRAAVARARGLDARAVEKLRDAATSYDAVEMKVHAACARRAAGALLGGPEGDALVARADEILHAEDIVDPPRWARMYTGIAV